MTDLTTACVAQYKCNDDAADTVVAESVAAVNGRSVANTEDMAAAGLVGGALTFGSATEKIDTTQSFQSILRDTFSMNVWVKTTEGQSGDTQTICGVMTSAGAMTFTLTIGGTGLLAAYYGIGTGTILAVEAAASFISGANPWRMVTLVATNVDDLTGHLAIYVDGELVKQGATDAIVFGDYTSDLKLWIAMLNGDGSPQHNFDGYIDNFCIFNRALTQAEIDSLYNSGAGTEALERPVLTMSTPTGGSALPASGSYDKDEVVAITATAVAGYTFVAWTGTAAEAGKVADATAATTTVTMSADYTLAATFVADGPAADENMAEGFATLLEEGGRPGYYLPSGGTARALRMVVIHEKDGKPDGLPHGTGPLASVLVANDATTGISRAELDTGGDKIFISPHPHQAGQWRRISGVLYEDNAVLSLQVA